MRHRGDTALTNRLAHGGVRHDFARYCRKDERRNHRRPSFVLAKCPSAREERGSRNARPVLVLIPGIVPYLFFQIDFTPRHALAPLGFSPPSIPEIQNRLSCRHAPHPRESFESRPQLLHDAMRFVVPFAFEFRQRRRHG